MKGAISKSPRLSRADQTARATMLDAFDAMPTSGERHAVAGWAVVMATTFRNFHESGKPIVLPVGDEWTRNHRRVIRAWTATRKARRS